MRKSNKLLAALMIGLVITVTVLSAGLDGIWIGRSDGTSVIWGGITFYPWDYWSCNINDMDLVGTWTDGIYQGRSWGTKIDSSYNYTVFAFEGDWSLYYNNNYITMGSFYIRFDTVSNTCGGFWVCDSTSDEGGIYGAKQ